MISLPIDVFLPQIVETAKRSANMVIAAPPGAGKTTRVAPALVQANVAAGAIIMLQPRRVAARASAERIAEEWGWELGGEVGYHIRFEKRYSARTKIRVLTEAILTRMLMDDPYLEGVGCVILDEFHERNLHTDLAVAFLRELQQTVRPDLKIIVMSATLDAERVAGFLGNEGEPAPIIVTEGRMYPVEMAYRSGRDVRLEEHVGRVVSEAVESAESGDLLVFLPGVGEIERVRGRLLEMVSREAVILPLHGSLSAEEQHRALRADREGRRKIILATNIAETSLTIDGVRTVIDSGLARVASFDAERGMDRLELERISQASATQRAGRAGRQGPGRAFRLWSELEQKHLPAFNEPDVRRVDLAGTLLTVHGWGAANAGAFGWFEKPPEERLEAAERLLELLGALEGGALTAIGKLMLYVPAHPRIARMLIGALGTELREEAITLAAILSEDLRLGAGSDLLMMVERPPVQIGRVREQLARTAQGILGELKKVGVGGMRVPRTLAELLLIAYPDRVAKRRGERGPEAFLAVMVGGTGVRLAPEVLTPAIASTPLFLALDARQESGRPGFQPRGVNVGGGAVGDALVRSAVPVEEESLVRLFPEAVKTSAELVFDSEREKIVALTRRRFFDLILNEDPHGSVDPVKAGPLLAEALAERVPGIFMGVESCAQLLARVALVRHYFPTMEFPVFDVERLRGVLVEACERKRSVAELLEGGGGNGRALHEALMAALPYPLDRELEKLAPTTIEVPSRSAIRIEYSLPAEIGGTLPAPVLAVRLQELFGWTETPRICGGRVPLLLHLLSPGFKPIQITADLASFWRSAYFEVRKDLRVRYPKHKWPDDPLAATPEAKGRHRPR